MERVLQLKEVAPYAPYGLLVKTDRLGVFKIDGYRTLKHGTALLSNDTHIGYLHEVKPILRPLSDLWNKEFRRNELTDYIKYDRSEETFVFDFETSTGTIKTSMVIDLFDFLYKHHFDIFGLIPAGLAIDINQTKQEV